MERSEDQHIWRLKHYCTPIDNLLHSISSEFIASDPLGLWAMHEKMFTVEKGDRPDAPNVAILLTDGESSVDKQFTLPQADQARSKGITIYSIGVGEQVLEMNIPFYCLFSLQKNQSRITYQYSINIQHFLYI